jgi:hypothetical protein
MKILFSLVVLLVVISIINMSCTNTELSAISTTATQVPTQQTPTTPTEISSVTTPIQQPTPTTTPSKILIPTPKLTTPGTGAIIGQVMFPDGSPAYRSIVYIFKGEETHSFASCYVDANGYYMFDELPLGNYSIYVASYGTFWGFNQEPDAIVSVSERETTTAPTLTVLGNMEIVFDNPRIAGIPGEDYTSLYVISGPKPKFTWNSVPNTSYYIVTIKYGAVGTETIPLGLNYIENQEVTDNIILWATDLSILPHHRFIISVEAYTKDNVLIASGSELFSIDNPPEGWAFK